MNQLMTIVLPVFFLLGGFNNAVAETQKAASVVKKTAKKATKPTKKKAERAKVEIVTSLGKMTAELYPEIAPKTVENFLKYVDAKFYDDLIFHRVIKGFMIQGGGFDENMKKKENRKPIPLEAKRGLSNLRGTLAMARTNDPNSATGQFFINHGNNQRLDSAGGGYAVFGKVISGLETVDKIAEVKVTTKGSYQNVPKKSVTIKSIRRTQNK